MKKKTKVHPKDIGPNDPRLRAEFDAWVANERGKSPKVVYTNNGKVAEWNDHDKASFALMDKLESIGWDINEHNASIKENRPYRGSISFWLKLKKLVKNLK